MYRRGLKQLVNKMMFALTLVSLSVLCVAVWRVLDSPVRGFVIEGDLTALEQVEVEQALSVKPIAGVLSADLYEVSRRLEHLPWAREISVRRSWPDQLTVTLGRSRPVARWGEDQYVSAYGDLLSLPDEYLALPQFNVAVSSPEQAMQVYRLLDQIAAREALAIAGLQQNGQGEWEIDLLGGPIVRLGAEQLNERMHRFLLVYRRVLQDGERPAEYVDARYANGVAVRFMENEILVARNSGSFSESLSERKQ
jgi:cell division protein FtsQ